MEKMKLPDKIWITEETAEYGGKTEPYLSINDPNDLSPGAVPYVPASEAERLREALRNLVVCCEHEAAFRGEKPHAFVVAGREALGGGEEKK